MTSQNTLFLLSKKFQSIERLDIHLRYLKSCIRKMVLTDLGIPFSCFSLLACLSAN